MHVRNYIYIDLPLYIVALYEATTIATHACMKTIEYGLVIVDSYAINQKFVTSRILACINIKIKYYTNNYNRSANLQCNVELTISSPTLHLLSSLIQTHMHLPPHEISCLHPTTSFSFSVNSSIVSVHHNNKESIANYQQTHTHTHKHTMRISMIN